MNDSSSALAVLRQARDILAQRLAERILEMREEVLDDAQGLTYCGEIDAIYDQIAVRLQHVNVMISNLPAAAESSLPTMPLSRIADVRPGAYEGHARWEASLLRPDNAPSDRAATAQRDLEGTFNGSAPFEATALPAPVTYELFLRQVATGELESAVQSLAVLFAVDEGQARCSVRGFHRRWRQSPELLVNAAQLSRQLQKGNTDEALGILRDCFGLQGALALSVTQTLRARLVGLNEAL